MSKQLEILKREAREAELQVIERAEPSGLHITVIGDRVVHWWPESRRMTAYVEGTRSGQSYVNAKRVIALASGAAK